MRLAEIMSVRGSSVVVIDENPVAFGALPAEFSGFTLEGDAAEIAVLRQAKCAQADLVVAVTGSDNLNIMAAQAALRFFGARRAVARVEDAGRVAAFEGSGIEIVSPMLVSADLFLAPKPLAKA